MKRPYMKKTVYELADIVAKEFATNPTDKKTVRDFIDGNFLARDSRALRNHIKNISPDVILQADAKFEDGVVEPKVMFPLGSDFFWPDAGI